MDLLPKNIPVSVYDPEGKTLHIVVKLVNKPGALSEVTALLASKGINILSGNLSVIQRESEGAVSFFAETGSAELKPDEIRRLLRSSKFVLDCEVAQSDSGLLVDAIQFPLVYYPGGRGVLFPQTGIEAMFSDLVSTFGSGGELILFRSGYAVGRRGTQEFIKLFGEDLMLGASESFIRLYNALGWGQLELARVNDDMSEFAFTLKHGFECEGTASQKPRSHFTRGLIAGSVEALLRTRAECLETECISKGDKQCTFVVRTKPGEAMFFPPDWS